MMSWDWCAWKSTPEREARLDEQNREAERKANEPVSQESDSFENFTNEERTIGDGIMVVEKAGEEAPWLSAMGACMTRVNGIRRTDAGVEFGVGNKRKTILAWVKADDFYYEWPQ